MWEGEPSSTDDPRLDAGIAAMAEYLARRDRWIAPEWARVRPDRGRPRGCSSHAMERSSRSTACRSMCEEGCHSMLR
jgi:hypothetical protein